jgi:hypothetical protein
MNVNLDVITCMEKFKEKSRPEITSFEYEYEL